MEPDTLTIRSRKLGKVVRILGLVILILGVVFTAVFISLTGGDTLEQLADDIMMEPKPVTFAAGSMILSVILSGLVSAVRFAGGWLILFVTASFLTTMTLLMGVGSVALLRNIFLALMSTALLCWAAAVLYYLYDLYR